MLETLIGIFSTAFFAAFGWAIHISNRVAIVETQKQDLVTLVESRFDDVDRRLERIERGMNGHLKDLE